MNIKRFLISQTLLIRAFGFSRATFYRHKADPNFPKPIKFNKARQGLVYYRVCDVEDYINKLGEEINK